LHDATVNFYAAIALYERTCVKWSEKERKYELYRGTCGWAFEDFKTND